MQKESTHFESLYPEDTRFSEVQTLLAFAKEGNASQLIGLSGVGKGNVMRLLTYNKAVRLKHLGENQKWFHFVMVDFSEVRRRPLLDVTKFLFIALTDSLRERGMTEYEAVNEMLRESISLHDELILFQGLKRAMDYLAIEKELTVVYLFDRFEEYVPIVTTDFFANLRVLRNRAKYRFSAVFALNRSLEDLVDTSILTDFYDFVAGHHIYVSITDPVGAAFRLLYLEKVTEKTIPEAIKEKILSLTGGHVQLIRLCAEAYLTHEGEIQNTTEDLLTFFLSQKTVEKAVAGIWNGLSPAEQTVLGKKEFDDSSEAVYLEHIGLVNNKAITIPLLAFYLSVHTEEFTAEEKIVYNTEKNEIKKGNDVLSDSLTSSEFLLLAFLLQNESRIIERDEIISAVWKDAKTTEGVTDQAVDQLTFRLRKKIEDDPNNPVHIVTVKGRGLKFAS